MALRLRWLASLGAVAAVASACNGPVLSTAPTPSAAGTGAVAGATAQEESYPEVVSAVSPSIVLIETPHGLGSGVVFDSAGDIVTNAHVVSSDQTMVVTASDGQQYVASVVGTYVPGDVAVIKVNASLRAARWGDSSKLKVGQVVLAIGNPLGLQSSVTEGIVSGLGRTVSEPNGAVLVDVVQTSAAINPGNSGGALVDLQSEVVGVPTLAAYDPQMGGAAPGIGFALSSNRVTDYADQIVRNGRVVNTHRAYLGVQVGEVADVGLVVLGVAEGGPAWNAGIRTGDVIVSVNGKPTTNAAALTEALAMLNPGDVATVGLKRGGHVTTTRVTLGALPAQQ